MTPAWVGMGSNSGSSQQILQHALGLLAALPDTRIVAISPLYRTAPWGLKDQPHFFNAVVELATALAPRPLLTALLQIEQQLGRRRDGPRWGPRRIDLDLLVHGAHRLEESDLAVPHPRLHQRAFVLVPLNDIAPALEVPGQGRVDHLMAALDAGEFDGIERIGPEAAEWPGEYTEFQ